MMLYMYNNVAIRRFNSAMQIFLHITVRREATITKEMNNDDNVKIQ